MAAAIETRRQLGENWYNMLLTAYLADAHRRRGELERARDLIDGAFADAEAVYVPEILRIKGEIEATEAASATPRDRRKGIEAAAECFRSAIALAVEHGTKLFELKSSIALARLLDGRDGSAETLASVRTWFSPDEESSDLHIASELLKRLERGDRQ